jgi:hypothetical protein
MVTKTIIELGTEKSQYTSRSEAVSDPKYCENGRFRLEVRS